MPFENLNSSGIVLLGCGKMGAALLQRWLARGLEPSAATVIEPNPSDWIKSQGVRLNVGLPSSAPSVCVVAVKPQIMLEALSSVKSLGGGSTLFLSIAAGFTIGGFASALGQSTKIIRAMPNTPAAIGMGITALVGGSEVAESDMVVAESLMSAVGDTVRLDHESQIDAVTAVSGSGPAYVFHLIEALVEAAEQEGLPKETALRLAKATVAGAGGLALESGDSPRRLRENVTSPGGTTAEALKVLMDDEAGFPPLLKKAVKAAADRGRELGSAYG